MGDKVRAIADDLGVHRNTINHWCEGVSSPRDRIRAKERGLVAYNRKLYREGYSQQERADILAKAAEEGAKDPPPPRRFKADERRRLTAEACVLRGTGSSIRQIARQLGISETTATKWTKGVRCPVNHRPKGNPGWVRRGSVHEVRHAA